LDLIQPGQVPVAPDSPGLIHHMKEKGLLTFEVVIEPALGRIGSL